MTNIQFLYSLLKILYPEFYTLCNYKLEELVFLDDGPRLMPDREDAKTGLQVADFIGDDKTQCEATNNHFHLFYRGGEKNRELLKEVGVAIAKNLLKALTISYPEKKFIVYLEINVKDSVIIRFHQVWDGEPQYFDIVHFQNNDVQLFEFKN